MNDRLDRLTRACMALDETEILAAIDAGAEAYHALLMLVSCKWMFDIVLVRSTPKDRIQFCAHIGGMAEEARLRVQAWGRKEAMKRLLT